MKQKYFSLLALVPICFLLTGCTDKDASETSSTLDQTVDITTSDGGASDNPVTNKTAQVTVDQVLSLVGDAAGLSNPMAMRLRRTVDNVSLNDEGMGYTVRSISGDQRFVQQEQAISDEMRGLGFTVKESKPESPDTFITKFIKYEKGNTKCTFEVRRVGTTGQSDLTFGCL
ncbi:MAG: hypothetical protein WC243_03340 [Patescibacteria group bacterium]|jgi:hypothetical protein